MDHSSNYSQQFNSNYFVRQHKQGNVFQQCYNSDSSGKELQLYNLNRINTIHDRFNSIRNLNGSCHVPLYTRRSDSERILSSEPRIAYDLQRPQVKNFSENNFSPIVKQNCFHDNSNIDGMPENYDCNIHEQYLSNWPSNLYGCTVQQGNFKNTTKPCPHYGGNENLETKGTCTSHHCKVNTILEKNAEYNSINKFTTSRSVSNDRSSFLKESAKYPNSIKSDLLVTEISSFTESNSEYTGNKSLKRPSIREHTYCPERKYIRKVSPSQAGYFKSLKAVNQSPLRSDGPVSVKMKPFDIDSHKYKSSGIYSQRQSRQDVGIKGLSSQICDSELYKRRDFYSSERCNNRQSFSRSEPHGKCNAQYKSSGIYSRTQSHQDVGIKVLSSQICDSELYKRREFYSSERCNNRQSFSRSEPHGKCNAQNLSNHSYIPLNRLLFYNENKGNVSEKLSERDKILIKYRKDYCPNYIKMKEKLDELSNLKPEEIAKKDSGDWIIDSPSELYYVKSIVEPGNKESTEILEELCSVFEESLIKRAERERTYLSKYGNRPSVMKKSSLIAKCKNYSADNVDSSKKEHITLEEEFESSKCHPFRLHPDLWYNKPGEKNTGPLCRCSYKSRNKGIVHNIYVGEGNFSKCLSNSNNAQKLFHYKITIIPATNFLSKTPTIISYNYHEYLFEGFSMFSHAPLGDFPLCKAVQFSVEYSVFYSEEKMPENFTIRELDLFCQYLFKEILELVDLDFRAAGDANQCSLFHFMPRFVRKLPGNGQEVLSMSEVLTYLLKNSDDLVKESELEYLSAIEQNHWQNQVEHVNGMVVTYPGMKPSSLRVDRLDRDKVKGKTSLYPEIVHFATRPAKLSYLGNPEYKKAWREVGKLRHSGDIRKLKSKEQELYRMRRQSKRDVLVTVNSKGFKKTGIMCDIVHHAMLIPVLVSHLRFHSSLSVLEETIGYKFRNRFLLQVALTHPSYEENYGTNPDHARNSLTNCGIHHPVYGNRRMHYLKKRKRGIDALIDIMSRFGKKKETISDIYHNDRLEFLGDAVVELITTIHLFHMFPDLSVNGLTIYRKALIENQHLAEVAKSIELDRYMLYAHGPDLCHSLDLRRAMANCCEALLGAIFLDGGIEIADKVFGEMLFKSETELHTTWVNYPPHPLQEQEPLGDRHLIENFVSLKKLTKFEDDIGVQFRHIRLLARAFTHRSIGFTNLTLGSNRRLAFLGDSIIKLITTDYLYKHFPYHHEGHLGLLRNTLVSNKSEADTCSDLGLEAYAVFTNPKGALEMKHKADLFEAFIGALYLDKGLEFCKVLCNVCLFSRLQATIMKQDWNDPKSKLQQWCYILQTMEDDPKTPVYRVIKTMNNAKARLYTVAVYIKGKRLASATGHNIQQAEMNAARNALKSSRALFF